MYEEAVARIDAGMYEWTANYRHRYPRLFAYAAAPFTWAGLDVWRALHLVALVALPWKVAALVRSGRG